MTQYSLFGRKTRTWPLRPRFRKAVDTLRALALHAGKTILKRKKVEEKNFAGSIKQYGDMPLFYGLPTMERWLEWEKKNGNKSPLSARKVSKEKRRQALSWKDETLDD